MENSNLSYMIQNIKEIVLTNFRVQPKKIKKLDGYANTNYLIESQSRKYILKEYIFEPELYDFLQTESQMLASLSKKIPGYFQQPVKTKNDEYLPIVKNNIYRLITYVEGDLLANAKQTEELLLSFGTALANMDLVLQEEYAPAIKARRYEWDILQIDLSKKYFLEIENPANRKLVEYFYMQFNEEVRPLIPELRQSIIHADANDYNVLIKNGKVSGIIDFGDSVYSLLINELAIALVYVMFGRDKPLETAIPVISAYHKILPLQEKELDILYYLIAARLCISVSQAAHEKKQKPDDPYITISEKPAWELLKKWLTINPLKAADTFRKAAGYEDILNDTTKQDVQRRWKHLSKALSLTYPKPIKMTKAAFQYMYDSQGNTYLDTRNNIPHVGHSHPRVVAAAQRKMAQLNTNTRYLYDEIHEFSEQLLAKFPKNLNKIFFVNSGSAASDLAIRLAHTHTKKQKIAAMQYGYHGNTQTSIGVSHYKFAGKGGSGNPDNIIIAEAPDTYRGKYTDEKTAGKNYALDFIRQAEKHKNNIAAFIAEPLISAAGQVAMPQGYLQEVYQFIRSQGGICISDEVQTGFGRLGTHFWAYEASTVVPDVVVLGKPIGNGHPMAAVVCTEEIADSFANGMEFFSSFGGNPVSCAIGIEVLKVIEEEQLMQNALNVGNYMVDKFKELQKQYPVIGDIRGSGLALGIDFVKNKQTKEENTELASQIVNQLKEKGILIGTDGPKENVLKIKPPLCFTKENTDELITAIEEVLMIKP